MSEAQSIQINDTPLVSMVLVDDENNRTTFNGPIINDFTITEDLQSKITQLTTLATNIGNLQTRLQNITNILNTQNIEFTDNISDVSSAGSKLYIQPQIGIKLFWTDEDDTEIGSNFINLTSILTGKVPYPTNQTYNINTFKNRLQSYKLCIQDTTIVPTPNLNVEATDFFIKVKVKGTTTTLYWPSNSEWHTNKVGINFDSPSFTLICEDSVGTQYSCIFNLSSSME